MAASGDFSSWSPRRRPVPRGLSWTILLLALTLETGCNSENHETAENVVQSKICDVSPMEGWAVNYPKQRKLFVIDGALWVFYSDGLHIYSRTSPDGQAWSEPALVREAGVMGHRIGLWFDGLHLHYAFCEATLGSDVTYRRGVPERDGTITWSAPEQVVYAMPASENAMYPKVVTDSEGRPWVGYTLVKGGITTPPYDGVITRSTETDGTWSTAPGFPAVQVHGAQQAYPDMLGTALSGEKTFWVYNLGDKGDPYRGRLWNGTGWESEEEVTRSDQSYGLFHVAAEQDDVHLVAGGGTIVYRRRSGIGDWGQEEVLTRFGNGHTTITRTGVGGLIVTWLNKSNHRIFFRELTDGRWGQTTLWVDESEEGLADTKNGINSNGLVEWSEEWKAAAVYTTGTQPPYSLKFAGIQR